MFVLALKGNEREGLYAVPHQNGERVLYIFKEEDDAERYAMLLEAEDYPQMSVIEVEDEQTIEICEDNNYTYAIINKDDLVIPPKLDDDLF